MTSEKNHAGIYFLTGTIILFIISLIIDSKKGIIALNFFKDTFIKIMPVIIMIFVLMALSNYFINPKKLIKHLGKGSGIKGWIIVIISGIISSGPIYMWYPLLNDLQNKGMRNGLIATFLYNRAVKIPLLPLLISYFGLLYTIVLTVITIFISVIQGLTTEKLIEKMEVKK